MADQELTLTDESLPQQKNESAKDLLLAEQELSPQERMFCCEYLVEYKSTRAALSVGLAASTGINWLRKPKIAKYIRLLGNELAAESIISRDMVQYELLHEFLPMAKGETIVKGVDRDGIQFEGYQTNMAAYGRAIDLMAKHSGFTVPEVVAGDVNINIDLGRLGIKATNTIKGEYSEQIIEEDS